MNNVNKLSPHDPEKIVNTYADRSFIDDYGIPCSDTEAMTFKELIESDRVLAYIKNALTKLKKRTKSI